MFTVCTCVASFWLLCGITIQCKNKLVVSSTGGCIQADETVVICITYFADCIDNWRGSFLVYI